MRNSLHLHKREHITHMHIITTKLPGSNSRVSRMRYNSYMNIVTTHTQTGTFEVLGKSNVEPVVGMPLRELDSSTLWTLLSDTATCNLKSSLPTTPAYFLVISQHSTKAGVLPTLNYGTHGSSHNVEADSLDCVGSVRCEVTPDRRDGSHLPQRTLGRLC